MMIVMGNGSSFLGRYLGQYYFPVANTTGVNTTWNFFSPDPAHIMYVHYIVHFEDDYGNPTKDPKEYFYPEQKDGSNFAMNVRRHNYMMRFMVIDPIRVAQFFVPWVCKQNPGSTKVQFALILHRIPSLDKVITLKDTPYSDLLTTEELNQNVYSCQKPS